MKRLIFIGLLFLIIYPSSASAIQICNRFSTAMDKICTIQANCPDADSNDAGTGNCETVSGSTLAICNRWSTSSGLVCTVQGDCPDTDGGDGGTGDCGVAMRTTTNFSFPVAGYRHPGPPGAQNYVYQQRLLAEGVDTQIQTRAPSASPTFTGTVIIPTPFTLGAVSVLPTGTELNFVDGVTSSIQTQLTARLPLTGGTMTGQLVLDNLAVEFEESDTNPTCSSGNYTIYADLSEAKFKKCTNGVSADLDTTGAITDNSVGPTQIDETANYAWTGVHTDNGNILRGVVFSTDCPSEDISFGGFCLTTASPYTVYYCPLPDESCDTPGELIPLPTSADISDSQSLNSAAENGRFILGADSEENATIIACIDNNADGDCTDAGDSSMRAWIDPVNGPTFKSYPDGHVSTTIPTTFAWVLVGSAGELERITSAGVHTYSNVLPTKSVEPIGHGFGSCTYSEGVLNTSKPITGYFVCTDADADGFDFDWIAPDAWNAGTVTVEIAALSTNATPSGNLVMSCSGQAVRSADVIANRATTGEQTASVTFATTSKEQHGTTSAITLQGTTAAGAHIYMHCDVDATLTTTTMADVKIIATPKIEYSVGNISDS